MTVAPPRASTSVEWANPDVSTIPHIVTEVPGPASVAYRKRILRHTIMATPAPNLHPVTFQYGHGVTLTDVDGNTYIDLSSGTSVSNLGHGHPRLAEVHGETAAQMTNVHEFATTHKADALEELASVTPEGMGTFAFFSSGAEAIEGAMRVARAITGRDGFIGFFNDYHGRTSGAAGVTATLSSNGLRAAGSFIVPNGCTAPPGLCKDETTCDLRCANVVDRMITQNLPGQLAGAVMELIQNGHGSTTYQSGYVARVAEKVRSHGGLLIADEVATGFGRTGTWWAAESEGVVPDIMVIGKGMGNGFPISAIVVKDEHRDALLASMPSSSYGGNPLGCAIVAEVTRIMKREGVVEHCADVGRFALERMHQIASRHPIIGQVRGRGLLLGFDLVTDRTSMTPSVQAAQIAYQEATKRGIVWTTSGNMLKIKPPIVISREVIAKALDIVEESIAVAEHHLNGQMPKQTGPLGNGATGVDFDFD